MRALILFLTGWYAGGEYLPVVTDALQLYDDAKALAAKHGVNKTPSQIAADVRPALQNSAEKRWMDRAGNPNAGG